MFSAIAIFICAMELWATYMGSLTVETVAFFWQAEAVLLVMLGLFSCNTQRDKSVFSIFVLWFGWIVFTDMWPNYLSDYVIGFETLIFSFFVGWALARPYFYPSADLAQRGENVYIGFYQGTHAPFLSSLAALVGLPFPSIVILAGDKVLRSSGAGKMMLSPASILSANDFTFVDTKQKATAEMFAEIAKCEGLPTKALGIFKTKCVRNCEPVLELLGLKPRNLAFYMPSIFYYQVVRGNRDGK